MFLAIFFNEPLKKIRRSSGEDAKERREIKSARDDRLSRRGALGDPFLFLSHYGFRF